MPMLRDPDLVAIEPYWRQFLRSLPFEHGQNAHLYEAFHFGTTAESADELASLVLCGIKTATGSLLWVYEAEGKPQPKAGEFSIVTNAAGVPVCVIETTDVRIVPFDQADEQLARDGGEGDRSLAHWRKIYWDYIVAECRRIGRVPTSATPLVAERFRVVYAEPPQ